MSPPDITIWHSPTFDFWSRSPICFYPMVSLGEFPWNPAPSHDLSPSSIQWPHGTSWSLPQSRSTSPFGGPRLVCPSPMDIYPLSVEPCQVLNWGTFFHSSQHVASIIIGVLLPFSNSQCLLIPIVLTLYILNWLHLSQYSSVSFAYRLLSPPLSCIYLR